MKIVQNGQGVMRKNLDGEASFESFVPSALQSIVPLALTEETVRKLSSCSRKIGELEGMLQFVPNSDLYLAMYVRKEALLSAQIEGTQCTFDDIVSPARKDLHEKDIVDVVNYVAATDYAKSRINELPLCSRLFKELHSELLASSRGMEKHPGEMRTSQNWIGAPGCSLNEAAFVPPNIEDMSEALSLLEKFINEPDIEVDPIVRAALVHYQFETIHPFLDGNGRLGRLLITLMLMNDGVLSDVAFYPSYELKRRRHEYYEQLMDVRINGTYEKWISFFCECMEKSAEDAIGSLKALVRLKSESAELINSNLGRSAINGMRFLELLEEHPIVEISFVSEKLEISRTTASNLVNSFNELGILRSIGGEKQRYRMFVYSSYIEILSRGADPL